MSPQAKQVEYQSPYCLRVAFANGEVRVFNLAPYLGYPVYQKLADEGLCANAAVANGVVVWDDETDVDPDRLYLESVPLIEMNVGNMNDMA